MVKRKILVIPSYRIFPIESGGAHGQLTFLDQQQHEHDITLLVVPENIQWTDIPSFQKRFPALKIAPIGFDLKKQRGIKAFINKQVQKFSGKDFSYITRKVRHLNGFVIVNPLLLEKMEEYVKSNQFDLIQVEHLRNAGLIPILPKETKRIFILHELGFLRVEADLKSLGYNKAFSLYMAGFTEGAEIFWMQQYDGVITFNEDDLKILEERGVKVPIQVASPFALFNDELKKVYTPAKNPQLIFIGGEEHYPNKEGLTWFLQHIFPFVLQRHPSLKLIVTSRWSDSYKNEYSSKNIVFTGFIEDLDQYLESSVLINPIRIGSGIRVKVFTSMAKGLPVVSTTLGASGIPNQHPGKNILIEDDENGFANSIVKLIEDEALRKEISSGAFNLATQSFAAMQFTQERNKFYEKIWNS